MAVLALLTISRLVLGPSVVLDVKIKLYREQLTLCAQLAGRSVETVA
jgi:hypothetical protein